MPAKHDETPGAPLAPPQVEDDEPEPDDLPASGLIGCPGFDTAVAIEPAAFEPALGAPPAELGRQLAGRYEFSNEGSTLVVELGEPIATRRLPAPCSNVLFDVPARVLRGEATLAELQATFEAPSGPLRAWWSYRSAEPAAPLRELQLEIEVGGSGAIASSARVVWEDESVDFGTVDAASAGLRRRYAPREGLEDVCAAVRELPLTVETRLQLASDAEASAAAEGVWARCDGPDLHDFAGVVIEGGRWHHLVAGEAGLEERWGFGREGRLLLHAPPPDVDGAYQLDLWSPAAGALPFTLYPEGMRMSFFISELYPSYVSSLVRAPLAAAAPAQPFAPGERGGAPACAGGERGLLDVSGSAEAALQALGGRWVRCSGSLPGRLEVDETGSLRALDEAGGVLLEGRVRFPNGLPDPMNVPGTLVTSLSLPFFSGTYDVALSETPRKLYLSSVVGGVQRVTVYSAE